MTAVRIDNLNSRTGRTASGKGGFEVKISHKMSAPGIIAMFCLIGILAALGTAFAEMPKHMVKAIFDYRDGNSMSAPLHLDLVRQTCQDMSAGKGKGSKFVVVFIGPSVKLISTKREGMSAEDKKASEEMAATVSAMAKAGIKLEVCMVALKVMGVDPATVLPEIKKVSNGWISEIEYETEGYALVPVY